VVQDLPDGAGGDLIAQTSQFALYSSVAPGRILYCQARTSSRISRLTGGRPGRVWG
jgi:hypothetical protein